MRSILRFNSLGDGVGERSPTCVVSCVLTVWGEGGGGEVSYLRSILRFNSLEEEVGERSPTCVVSCVCQMAITLILTNTNVL